MKKMWFIIIASTLFGGYYALAEKGDSKSKFLLKNNAQSKPDVRTSVNRQYDDKGNLIGYDSTYSWSYTSRERLEGSQADSLFTMMRQLSWDLPMFGSLQEDGWCDSLLKQHIEGQKDANALFHQMESIRRAVLDQHFNGWRSQLKDRVHPSGTSEL